MKVLLVAAACCVPFAMIGSAHDSAPAPAHDATPVPTCLVTAYGTKLCDGDALAWCEDIDHEDLEGRATNSVRVIHVIDDADTRAACESVGWTS